MKFGDVKGQTEGTGVADQDISTANFKKETLKKKLKVDVDYVNNKKKWFIAWH